MLTTEFKNKEAFDAFIRDARQLKEFSRAAPAALNRTATSKRSQAVKLVAADLGIKQATVRERMNIRRATGSNLESAVQASGKRIPIIELKPTPSTVIRPQPGKGVRYFNPFKGGRRLIPGSFIAQMRSGHVGVFKRLGGALMKSKKKESIKELFGGAIPMVLLARRYRETLLGDVPEKLLVELSSALKFFKMQSLR